MVERSETEGAAAAKPTDPAEAAVEQEYRRLVENAIREGDYQRAVALYREYNNPALRAYKEFYTQKIFSEYAAAQGYIPAPDTSLGTEETLAAFEESYQKAIENAAKDGILNQTEMFAKEIDARKDFSFISDQRFNSLIIEAKKNGAMIIRGTEEIEQHLERQNASASTIGNLILFKEKVCVSEVLEETYHFMQNKHNVNDDKGEPLRTLLNEISAKEYILENAQKYKVPRKEVELIKKQLDNYKQQLKEFYLKMEIK